jgi:hypothetical protein
MLGCLALFLILSVYLMVRSILFSFQESVAIWQEFGTDLSGNLENQLIIFPSRRG